jgi:hypothetical protein
VEEQVADFSFPRFESSQKREGFSNGSKNDQLVENKQKTEKIKKKTSNEKQRV